MLTDGILSCIGVLISGGTGRMEQAFQNQPATVQSASRFLLSSCAKVFPHVCYCNMLTHRTHAGCACRASAFIQGLFSGANRAGVFSSPTATAYWAYHLTRTGFLAVQGVSGLSAAASSCSSDVDQSAHSRLHLLPC